MKLLPIIPGVHHCPNCKESPRYRNKVVWCSPCQKLRYNYLKRQRRKRKPEKRHNPALHIELDDELKARLKAYASANKWSQGETVRILLEHQLPEIEGFL
jgi:uncharacterized Zn finger protein (UPF0148 family)